MTLVWSASPGQTGVVLGAGNGARTVPAAYVCKGTVCGAPAGDAPALRDSFEQLVLR